MVRGRRHAQSLFSLVSSAKGGDPLAAAGSLFLQILILMRLEAPQASGFLTLGMSSSWSQAEEFHSRPHQSHDPNGTLEMRDGRESGASLPELALFHPTHSMPHNTSNELHHSLSHSFIPAHEYTTSIN